MSSGDWDPHFDLMHQVVDAMEALRDRLHEPRPAWLDGQFPPPSPHELSMPRLLEHRLPNGRVLIEPTSADVVYGTRGAAVWHDHFGDWEIGPCSCTEEAPQ